MEEIWKDIKGFEGLYQVSNLGRVKSLKKDIIMKPSKHREGYLYYILRKQGRKTFKAHRLVAITFIPNPESKPEVNHKDGNKKNNSADNLEWLTRSENAIHAKENNLIPRGNKQKFWKGFINIFSKNGILVAQVLSLRSVRLWLQKNTNYKKIYLSNVTPVIHGNRHTAYGFTFKRTKEKNEKYFVDDFDT